MWWLMCNKVLTLHYLLSLSLSQQWACECFCAKECRCVLCILVSFSFASSCRASLPDRAVDPGLNRLPSWLLMQHVTARCLFGLHPGLYLHPPLPQPWVAGDGHLPCDTCDHLGNNLVLVSCVSFLAGSSTCGCLKDSSRQIPGMFLNWYSWCCPRTGKSSKVD